MKIKMLFLYVLLLIASKGFTQDITQIEAKDGVHYITTTMEYPITGTYYFQNTEPTVELNSGGTGFYQLHEQPTRPVNWGIECDQTGEPKMIKGFDNAAYTLWYQYTSRIDTDDDENMMWKPVKFTVHFNSQKMFIQGERSKSYSGEAER